MDKQGELKEFENKLKEVLREIVVDAATKERIRNNIKRELEVLQNEK